MENPFDSGFFQSEELRGLGFKYIGENVEIARNCTIVGVENISVSNNVRIDGYCSLIAGNNGSINIGSYVHIAAYCSLSAGEGIEIKDFAGLSQRVTIYTRSDDYSGEFLTNPTVPSSYTDITRGSVILERHVIVGSGCTILPGVKLREGSSVGAHSLIIRDLEPWSVYFGAPARRLKDRSRALLEKEAALIANLGGPQKV